jgi:hypothetical protein
MNSSSWTCQSGKEGVTDGRAETRGSQRSLVSEVGKTIHFYLIKYSAHKHELKLGGRMDGVGFPAMGGL